MIIFLEKNNSKFRGSKKEVNIFYDDSDIDQS